MRIKKEVKKIVAYIWLVPVLTLALVSGCGAPGADEDVTSELVGKWYDKDYELAFEITQEGEPYRFPAT